MATARLTEKILDEIVPPRGRAVVVRDTEVAGFVVTIGARTRTYAVDYRGAGGARRLLTIGRHGVLMPGGREPWNVPRARARARVLLGQVAEGRDPAAEAEAPPPPKGPTLREGLALLVDNLRKRRKSERTIDTYQGDVERHLADWLDRPIVELTAAELHAIHRGIRERAVEAARKRAAAAGGGRKAGRAEGDARRPGQANAPGDALANRIVRHVKAIWNALDRVHELPGRNPARGVTPVALAARDTRVNEGEFATWRAQVDGLTNPVRRHLYELALWTGLRSGSLRYLREDDFDARAALLQVTRVKGGRTFTIPLGPRAVALLEARIADNAARFAKHGGPAGWIFPGFERARTTSVDGEPRRRVVALPGARDRDKKTGKRIGVPVHDLRRTWNSVAIEIGIPRESRESLANHAGRGVNVRHYGVPQNWAHLAECQRRIEDALAERLSAERG